MRGRLAAMVVVCVAGLLGGAPAGAQEGRDGDGAAWLEALRGATEPGSAVAWTSPDGSGTAPVAPASVQPLRDRPEGAATDAQEWRRAWEQAGAELRPVGDLATWLAAADVDFAQAPAEPENPLSGLGFIHGFTQAGDLDGDGSEDVLAFGQLYDAATPTSHALSGADGTELWRVPGNANFYGSPTLIPLGEGSGVLGATFLPGETVYQGRCDAEGCEETRTSAFSWQVVARAGATGEVLWERVYEGTEDSSFQDQSTAQGFSYSQVYDATDQNLVVLPGPDLDGDGVAEVLVSRGDVHRESEQSYTDGFGGSSSHSETLRATIVAEALSGATGEPLLTRVLPDVPATGVLRGAGDVDGDGVEDLLIEQRSQPAFAQTCTFGLGGSQTCDEVGERPRLEVELLDGASGDPVWRHVAPDVQDASLEGARADLDGDGGLDLLVTERRYDRPESALTAIAGADGRVLWRRAVSGFAVPLAVTPLDADGDVDVLLAVFPQSFGGPVAPSVTVERLDGSTGAVLLATTSTASDFDPATDYGYAEVTSPGDGDADGSADAAVTIEILDFEANAGRASLVLESGRTGARIFERQDGGFLRAAGDLDGDGGDDGLAYRADFQTGAATVEALRLRDGSTLWATEGAGFQFGPPSPAGDHDGDGRPDLLQLDSAYLSVPIGHVRSLNGEDGAERWSFPPARPVTIDRVAGDDRVATAVAVSQAAFATAPAAVLARADAYPDALAGGPLAAVLEGPLLLTDRERLDPRAREELQRLGVERVVLLGGTGALEVAVEQDLAALGVVVERVAGTDRFDTAGLIADRVVAVTEYTGEVLLVQGSDPDPARGWPDAVSASAFGATFRQPVLLTETQALPAGTLAALDRLRPSVTRIVGGTPAVADSVIAELNARGIHAERLAGENRFATARIMATTATAFGVIPSSVWVATGRSFPDALAAGAAVGATRGVLLLVDSPEGSGAGDAGAYLAQFRSLLLDVYLIGGPDVVEPEIEEFIGLVVANN